MPPTIGFDLSALGMSPELVNLVEPALATMPQISIDNVTGIGGNSGSKSGQLYHTFLASATHLRGAHNLRFGVDVRITEVPRNSLGNLTPPTPSARIG